LCLVLGLPALRDGYQRPGDRAPAQRLLHRCADYLEKRVKLLNRDTDKGPLLALFDRIREEGKGRAYDCVVGVSGGVDSSYVAYLGKV